MGTAAMVLGIVAVVLVILILFSPLGAFLGLLAVIFGIIGIIRAGRGEADNRAQAVTGVVTGAVALLVGLFLAISIGTFFATNVNDFRRFGRCMENARGDQARQACAEQLSSDLDR
jgi:membrane-bound ClpP family serine protease